MDQSRRTVMQAVGAGLLTQLAAGEASAQGEAQAQGDIWRGEYWANKGDVKLAMYRKRAGAPKAGEPPLPVLFLVHGSSISAKPTFDLTVPGKGEYSMMDVFERADFHLGRARLKRAHDHAGPLAQRMHTEHAVGRTMPQFNQRPQFISREDHGGPSLADSERKGNLSGGAGAARPGMVSTAGLCPVGPLPGHPPTLRPVAPGPADDKTAPILAIAPSTPNSLWL